MTLFSCRGHFKARRFRHFFVFESLLHACHTILHHGNYTGTGSILSLSIFFPRIFFFFFFNVFFCLWNKINFAEGFPSISWLESILRFTSQSHSIADHFYSSLWIFIAGTFVMLSALNIHQFILLVAGESFIRFLMRAPGQFSMRLSLDTFHYWNIFINPWKYSISLLIYIMENGEHLFWWKLSAGANLYLRLIYIGEKFFQLAAVLEHWGKIVFLFYENETLYRSFLVFHCKSFFYIIYLFIYWKNGINVLLWQNHFI